MSTHVSSIFLKTKNKRILFSFTLENILLTNECKKVIKIKFFNNDANLCKYNLEIAYNPIKELCFFKKLPFYLKFTLQEQIKKYMN